MSNKKNNGVSRLPEGTRERAAKRLRALRSVNNEQQADISILGKGTLTNYELHDPSPFRLGDMYAMSEFYNMNISEFIEILFSSDEEAIEVAEVRALARTIYKMPADKQKVIRTVVDALEME